MNAIIQEITASQVKHKVAPFKVGDGVRVHTKVREGDKERVQIFAGVVIAHKGSGIHETFTVRRISYGEGVERVSRRRQRTAAPASTTCATAPARPPWPSRNCATRSRPRPESPARGKFQSEPRGSLFLCPFGAGLPAWAPVRPSVGAALRRDPWASPRSGRGVKPLLQEAGLSLESPIPFGNVILIPRSREKDPRARTDVRHPLGSFASLRMTTRIFFPAAVFLILAYSRAGCLAPGFMPKIGLCSRALQLVSCPFLFFPLFP